MKWKRHVHQVGAFGSSDAEVASPNVAEGLVIQAEVAVSIIEERVGRQVEVASLKR